MEALSHFAVIVDALGRGTEAEQLQRRAIEITERTFGPEHPSLVVSFANLADRLQQQGRLYEAEPVARRAVLLAAKLFGPDQIEDTLPLSALGVVLAGLNRNDDALPILQRALDLRERVLGPDPLPGRNLAQQSGNCEERAWTGC